MNALTTTAGELAQATTDAQLIELWLAGRPVNTAAAYRRDVERFLSFVGKPLALITVGDLHDYAAHLGEPLPNGKPPRPATQRRPLAAVKSLLRYAVTLGYIRFDPGSVVKLQQGKATLSERILSEADIHRMISLESDVRNALLLRLLYATGGRVSEVARLAWQDIAFKDDGAAVVTLYGKGDKTRFVLVPATVGRDLRRRRAERDSPVFESRKGGPLTRVQIWRIVKAAADRAGLEASPSPHWFRHAHVSHALDRGAPAHLVQTTVGHASLDTTTAYSHARPSESSATYLAL